MGEWLVSPADSVIGSLNANIDYLLLGLYGWEYVHSFDVEYAVIRGHLSFRWSLIPYIVGRISFLLYLINIAVGTSPLTVHVNCPTFALLTMLSGDIALGSSSAIFMIRTWVIWHDSRSVRALLLLLSFGQWAMLVTNIQMLKTINIDGVCGVYFKHPQVAAATLMYTVCYDLLVFALSVLGLSRQRSESPLKKRLLAQGILYFAVTGMAYIPPVICGMVDTSLSMIFCSVAIAVSTIASSRAVRSLLFSDVSEMGQSPDNNIALTTQIAIHPSVTRDDTYESGQLCIDEVVKNKC